MIILESKINTRRPFVTMGHMMQSPLKQLFATMTFSEMERTGQNQQSSKVSYYYVTYSGNGSIFKSLNLIEFFMAGGQAKFFHTNLLIIFLRFELPPNCILQCYRPQTWQFYLLIAALFISSIHKVLYLRVGRSCDSLLLKAYSIASSFYYLLPTVGPFFIFYLGVN